jgi:MFS family permease
VVADIGGAGSEAWLGVANTLCVAAVSPIAGSVTDLIGRRHAALLGPIIIIVGLIVIGTAHRIDVAIGGSALVGTGAGLAETIGVAGLMELAPTKSRGKYVGTSILLDIPFGAALTYGSSCGSFSLIVAELYSENTWRWTAWIPLTYVGLTLVLIFLFYHPPPRPNSLGLTRREMVSRIDFIGFVLSISGIALFLMGLQWGGYN